MEISRKSRFQHQKSRHDKIFQSSWHERAEADTRRLASGGQGPHISGLTRSILANCLAGSASPKDARTSAYQKRLRERELAILSADASNHLAKCVYVWEEGGRNVVTSACNVATMFDELPSYHPRSTVSRERTLKRRSFVSISPNFALTLVRINTC